MVRHGGYLEAGLISVVVPVYNAEKTIVDTIESVLAQSYANIELILSDDGSTDESAKICERYVRDDSRVKLVIGENSGPSAARNRALPFVGGEFVFFLDADDTLLPDAISGLLSQQRKTGADIVVGDFVKLVGGKAVESDHHLFFDGDLTMGEGDIRRYVVDFYLTSPNRYPLFVYVWGRIFRTSLVFDGGVFFDEGLRSYEDVKFNFDVLRHVKRLDFYCAPVLMKSVNKHDGYAIGKLVGLARGWQQFGYVDALNSVRAYLGGGEEGCGKDERLFNSAFVVYTIITLIRLGGGVGFENWKNMRGLVKRILSYKELHEGLRFYRPQPGNSVVLPWLLRFRLVVPLVIMCVVKFRLRYK